MNAVALAYTNPNGAALNPNRTWSAPTPELIEHLPLGIGIEDTDGLLLECNQAFAATTLWLRKILSVSASWNAWSWFARM
ncbi:hypothetical protein ABWH92_00005 [Ahrensia marina]|uniref:hypothetical protein n=1 Tax=Ahrensia marina TaxID=1514904 RepID=UPI0035D11B3D